MRFIPALLLAALPVYAQSAMYELPKEHLVTVERCEADLMPSNDKNNDTVVEIGNYRDGSKTWKFARVSQRRQDGSRIVGVDAENDGRFWDVVVIKNGRYADPPDSSGMPRELVQGIYSAYMNTVVEKTRKNCPAVKK